MNSLSWFLLVVDWAGNFGKIVVIAASVSAMAIALRCLYAVMDDLSKERRAEILKAPLKYIVFAILVLLVGATPSQRTLYLIAASELGETALQTDEGRALRAAIQQQLQDYLNDLKSPKGGAK